MQYWSPELASLAAENACRCNFKYNGLPPIPYKNHYARENHNYYPQLDLQYMIHYWFEESYYYHYQYLSCYKKGYCEHYLNVSTAHTSL